MARKNRLRVVVCRGCCCGTYHAQAPGFDHQAQLRALKSAIQKNRNAELKTVSCLDHCSRANIVVLSGARALRSDQGDSGTVVGQRRPPRSHRRRRAR
jgi:predicted metal-binding protein